MAGLVKKLDELVVAHKELTVVVNFIGISQGDVANFGKVNGINHVALTTTDQKNADRFKVNSDAGVTVMNYVGKKVKANHAIPPGKLDEEAIAAIVDSAAGLVTTKK